MYEIYRLRYKMRILIYALIPIIHNFPENGMNINDNFPLLNTLTFYGFMS